MQTVYVENAIAQHPRTLAILGKIKPTMIIACDHYKEIFNPKNQNFRIQKKHPALLLAEKQQARVFKSPENFGIGGEKNYYFSHMLNCLYDCRYCFLQGMYPSANYVVFINYEDFMADIASLVKESADPLYFFSGYDCDSLAFEPVTQFVKTFLPFFRPLKKAFLELRTKSTNIKPLLKEEPFQHAIVAMSFTPQIISEMIEHQVPLLSKRLIALKEVAERGWPVGLRFDPLIYHPEFKSLYEELLDDVFKNIHVESIHSISIGPLRFPENMYQKIMKLYPNDPLFSYPLYRQGKIFSYQPELEKTMKRFIQDLLKKYAPSSLLFECTP